MFMKIPLKTRKLLLAIMCLIPISIFAQNIEVSGIVVDAVDKSPLIGVTVFVDGTTNGVVTDLDGRYRITSVPVSSTLKFNSIGYEEKRVLVKSQVTINVELQSSTTELDEIVVVGYGAVRKRDLTSATARVTNKEIEKTPVSSIEQALQGNAAGVMIITTSAEPGGEIAARIRGASSIVGNNSPLYVVDGFITDQSLIQTLNPNDISSMDVLKDASATAIYGSKGANGVIMITTKKGEIGKPKISFTTKLHYQKVRRKIPMMDSEQYVIYANDGRQATGTSITNLRPDTLETRNFQDEILKSHAIIQEYNLSISGGSKQMGYYLSANVLDQPGLLVNSEFNRIALRGRFNIEVVKSVDLEVGFRTSKTKTQKIGGGDSGAMMRTLMLRPTNTGGGIFSNGLFIDEETGEVLSANSEISKSLYAEDIRDEWLNEVNGTLNWKIDKHLTFRTTGAYRTRQRNSNYYVPAFIYLSQSNIDKNNIAKRGASTQSKFQNDNTLTYMNTFGEVHSLTAMIGQTWESSEQDGFTADAKGIEDEFKWDGIGSANLLDKMSTQKTARYRYFGIFTRVNYNYDNRYLVTGSMRADASSRFGSNSRWSYFPAISGSWILTNEKFFQKSILLSTLKFRVGWGMTGNDGIGDNRFKSTLKSGNVVINGVPTTGYMTGNIGDDNLSWEKQSQINMGIDWGFFKNRFFLTIDLFNKQTNSLLYDYRLPNTTGYQKVITNIGKVENKGIDIEFSSDNLVGAFKWKTIFNAGYNKGKIKSLGGDNDLVAYQMTNTVNTPMTYLIVGQPLGTFKGHMLNGVYKDWNDVYSSASVWYEGTLENRTEPGHPKYVDRNNDGVIDENDKVIMGHAMPDWNIGFTNSFSYQNFDLSVFFTGSFGHKIVNANKGKIQRYRGDSDNQTRYVMDGYRPRNPLTGDPGYYTTDIPRANYVSSSNKSHADYAQNLTQLILEDGDYLRLKTVSLGYNVPRKLLKKYGLSTCRLQLSGINLFTWTKYTGMDPESSSSLGDSNTRLGIDQSSYPSSRSYVLTLNLGF